MDFLQIEVIKIDRDRFPDGVRGRADPDLARTIECVVFDRNQRLTVCKESEARPLCQLAQAQRLSRVKTHRGMIGAFDSTLQMQLHRLIKL